MNSSDFMDFNFQLSFGKNVGNQIEESKKKKEDNKVLEQKLTKIKVFNKEKKIYIEKKDSKRRKCSGCFKLSSIEDAMLKALIKL
ncbi:unnamed protein product [Blepharisma stoltei]|uniref:Uncharacterized protein n=1 Tax=Blepharisma stoltei TaxID=1481888 RepID=A0AAU9JG38_9CILI|nr:unnamed protein product [Blepharisma stoltei]